jgi:hypothetical protein
MTYNWNFENDKDILRINCPSVFWPPLLHQQIDSLGINVPYRIEWPTLQEKTQSEKDVWPTELIIRLAFDAQLDSSKHDAIVQIITNHDATAAIQEEETKKQKEAEILAQNQALIESARTKRLAGEILTQQELAAIADLFIFQR